METKNARNNPKFPLGFWIYRQEYVDGDEGTGFEGVGDWTQRRFPWNLFFLPFMKILDSVHELQMKSDKYLTFVICLYLPLRVSVILEVLVVSFAWKARGWRHRFEFLWDYNSRLYSAVYVFSSIFCRNSFVCMQVLREVLYCIFA